MGDANQAVQTRTAARYEARRLEIVDIAARVFAERGFHGASVEDLSVATGLRRGGLYHYIGSKDELLFEIHKRFIEPLLAEAAAIEARGEPAEQTLRALAQALMTDIARYHDQVTVFLHEWRTLVRRDSPRIKKIMAARKEFELVVDRTLKRGVAEGAFHFEQPRLAVLGFLGMINYSYQWYRADGEFSPDEVANAFADYFLNGIRGRTGEEGHDARA